MTEPPGVSFAIVRDAFSIGAGFQPALFMQRAAGNFCKRSLQVAEVKLIQIGQGLFFLFR